MTTAVLDRTPVWRLAVASFAPPRMRARTEQWTCHLPLALILLGQFLLSLRLSNTPHSDEALYLYMGHWIRSGTPVYSNPETFFSGAPQLYPVLASYLDSLGGLGLARVGSGLCMVSATLAVYWTTSVLFEHRGIGRRPGLFAALAFSLSAPVMFLSHFATYDAPSFTAITWAMALGVWSSKHNRSPWWSLAIGGLLAFAVLLKYSSAIDVPFVLLLTLAAWSLGTARARTLIRALLSGLTTVILLTLSAVTWARSDLSGLIETTTGREVGDRQGFWHLGQEVLTWTGLTLALMIAGGIYLARRQPVLAATLLVGTLAATLYQMHMGEGTSLHKHVALGLLFGAPLAGLLLAELSMRLRPVGSIVVAVVTWVALIAGLSQSTQLFNSWANTSGLTSTLEYSVKQFPYVRMLGDFPEAQTYALYDRTNMWQWVATWKDSFWYYGQTNLPAYEHALRDNHFQLVFLAGHGGAVENQTCRNGQCSSISDVLRSEMPSFGFRMTSVVTSPNSTDTWQVWQRYDHIRSNAGADHHAISRFVDITWVRRLLEFSLGAYLLVLAGWAVWHRRLAGTRTGSGELS